MRILCVTANYPPHHSGGYETSCAGVMDGLVARGHHVTVLTSEDRVAGVPEVAGERSANPAVRRDIRRYFRDHDLWSPGLGTAWRIERANQRALRDAVEAARPDVAAVWHVGAFSLGIVTALVEAGIPVVYAISDDWPSYCLKLDRWNDLLARVPRPVRRALRPVLRVPTTVDDLGRTGPFCFISEETHARAVRYGTWTYPTAALVYSGIDRTLFTPRAATPPWRGRLLYVGRLDPRKGIETLVRAMALLPADVTLEVQGTGGTGEEDRLREIARSLGVADRIRFERVPREALPDRYRDADVCVFPSEWEEPFGLVPLEAMACGTPVVASGTGGSGEFLVHEGNCLRFTPGSPESLAAAVARLGADAALRDRLIAAGFPTAAYFDMDDLTDAFEAWYLHAAAPGEHPRPTSRRFDLDEVVAGG